VAPESQPRSPVEVTPTSCSTPPTTAKAGPPESPKQVCDGDGRKVKLPPAAASTRLCPLRFAGAASSVVEVRPKPTRRMGAPTKPASSAMPYMRAVAIGGRASRRTMAMSCACVTRS